MGSSPAPQGYQLASQPQQDAAATNAINTQAAMPNYGQQTYDQQAPQITSTADATAAAATTAGQNVVSNAAGLPGYEQMALDAGFDPQNALYARTAQQTQQQQRAALEARGVDSSPYGAGVEGDTMNNFNIDWQNTQLNREATAVQSGTALSGAYDTANATGVGLQALAPGLQQSATASLDSAGAAAMAKPQADVNNSLAYLNQGNSNAGTAVSAAKVNNDSSNGAMDGIGKAVGSIFGLAGGK